MTDVSESQFDSFVSNLLGELDGEAAPAPAPKGKAAAVASARSAYGGPTAQPAVQEESGEVDYSDDADTTPEDPASGDDDGEENESAEAQPIEPPQSWSAEEKAKFNELPPDLQSVVSRRESERDRAISRRMNELAEQRKAVDAKVAEASQVQGQYVQNINQLLTLTIPELQELQRTDWQKLANDDPSTYVARIAQRDSLVQRVNYMGQQVQQAQQQQQQQLAQALEARKAVEFEKLTQEIPEFSQPGSAKAVALVADITEAGKHYGFTPEEMNGIVDSRLVKALADLAQYRKAQNARVSAQTKRAVSPAQKPIPSTASPAPKDRSKNAKITEQIGLLVKSNKRGSNVTLSRREQEAIEANLISHLL